MGTSATYSAAYTYDTGGNILSTDVIKIKYSPKVYQTLMDTLLHEMAYKLKVCRFE